MTDRAAEGPGISDEVGGGAPMGMPQGPDVPDRGAPRPAVPLRVVAAVATVGTAAYAWFASATTPFTVAADVTTALPIVGMVAVVALQRIRPFGPVWQRLPGDQPPGGGTAVPWLVVLALLVVPEGVSLLAGGARSSHPTISFVTDTVFQWHAVKAAVYFVWMWLCWYFVRR